MAPPSRAEFLQSRFYRAALAFNKRNEERLNNIRDLLERVDAKEKRTKAPATRKKYVSTWQCPDDGDKASTKERNSQEDRAILSANKKDSDWIFDESFSEYSLILGGTTVMKVPADMYERLKSFQRDAVKWVACVGPIGGILADDMGMGKTFMSVASLGARMKVKKVRMVLIVVPTSVLGGWAKEAKKFLPKFVKTARVETVHSQQQKDRMKIIRNAWKESSPDRPRVIISSWGLVCSPRTIKLFIPPSGHNWDYVVLDEAHKIKNHKSNMSKCCKRICHKNGTKRLLLTGTPFQNDTTELWSIMHMATAGKVLGKLQAFNKEYGKPIRDARCKNASRYQLRDGEQANERLQETLRPYVLRRSKMDFLSDELPAKHETCVWVKPSKEQAKMYTDLIDANSSLAKTILSSDKDAAKQARLSAFNVISSLRGICSHPLRQKKGGADGSIHSALQQTKINAILQGSKKLELVIHMLKGFIQEDHKTLVFSQSTQNLDILQYVLKELGSFHVCRLDGSVSAKKRQDMVDCFQNGMFDVFLISTGAGGVGLTLTRASRVILYDPSWNPSEDAQAVDRAYRIGQHKVVQVYRLFVANSIEEKMYEKQVHKAGLEKTIFTKGIKPEERLFDKHELCKVFSQVPDGTTCELLKRFREDGVGKVPDAHRHDLVRLHSSVIGISNHSTVYRQKRKGAFCDAADSAKKRLKVSNEEDDGRDAVEEEVQVVGSKASGVESTD